MYIDLRGMKSLKFAMIAELFKSRFDGEKHTIYQDSSNWASINKIKDM